MKSFGFEVAHGYEILKGFVGASSKKEAIELILKQEWNDIVEEYETDILTEGYEVIDIWEMYNDESKGD